LTCRKRDLLDYREGRMPAGQELAGKRVACCIDAGKSRLRRVTRQRKGKGQSEKQRVLPARLHESARLIR
jgi:hypothetical protein